MHQALSEAWAVPGPHPPVSGCFLLGGGCISAVESTLRTHSASLCEPAGENRIPDVKEGPLSWVVNPLGGGPLDDGRACREAQQVHGGDRLLRWGVPQGQNPLDTGHRAAPLPDHRNQPLPSDSLRVFVLTLLELSLPSVAE